MIDKTALKAARQKYLRLGVEALEERIAELQRTIDEMTTRMGCGHIGAERRMDDTCAVCREIAEARVDAEESIHEDYHILFETWRWADPVSFDELARRFSELSGIVML